MSNRKTPSTIFSVLETFVPTKYNFWANNKQISNIHTYKMFKFVKNLNSTNFKMNNVTLSILTAIKYTIIYCGNVLFKIVGKISQHDATKNYYVKNHFGVVIRLN